jgi:GT2 family glycosyltransferase
MILSRGSAITKLFSDPDTKTNSYTLGDSPTNMAVPAVAGTVALISRDLFRTLKGFDERFFLYMEDTDLCGRLVQSGYQNWFVPTAGAVHEWGKGSAAGKMVRLYRHHISVWKYFLKHFPNGFSVVVLPFLLAGNFGISILLTGFIKGAKK